MTLYLGSWWLTKSDFQQPAGRAGIIHILRERDVMFGLGTPEIILILLVILIFFGSKKIPDLAQGLGKGIREFRKAARDVQDDIEKEVKQIDTNKENKKE